MAQELIIVHVMDPEEARSVVRALSSVVEETNTYVIGRADEGTYASLKGLNVRWEALGYDDADDPPVRERGLRGMPTRSRGLSNQPPQLCKLALVGVLRSYHNRRLKDRGLQIVERLGESDNGRLQLFRAQVAGSDIATIRALPFVDSIEIEEEEAIDDEPRPRRGRLRGGGGTRGGGFGEALDKRYVLIINEDASVEQIKAIVFEHEGELLQSDSRRLLVAKLTSDAKRELKSVGADLKEWNSIDVHVSVAKKLIGLPFPDSLAGAPSSLDGAGEVIAIADTGVDVSHSDFVDNPLEVIVLGDEDGSKDPDGHGTHVTGIVRSISPGAKIIVQCLYKVGESGKPNRMGGLPLDLQELLRQAYASGARIQNNSWGSELQGAYVYTCKDVDQFAWDHPDMLIVFSAGNAAHSRVRSSGSVQKGHVNRGSLCAPGTAKNAICVGASRSSRTDGPGAHTTHGERWSTRFPDPPMRDEPIAGDEQQLAGFSSRGPAGTAQIKPDVVAPGTDILSSRSAIVEATRFEGISPVRSDQAWLSGTSMAAPQVAGAAALVRQYLRQGGNPDPSASLLKAILINGAQGLKGWDAQSDHADEGNCHQGFGRIHLPSSIPNPSIPSLRLAYIDTYSGQASPFQDDDAFLNVSLKTSGERLPLRICLVYPDPPGVAVQNNLNLLVRPLNSMDGGFVGNQNAQFRPDRDDPSDASNNVECVRLNPAPGGKCIIQVKAVSFINLPPNPVGVAPGQHFALVATGSIEWVSDEWTLLGSNMGNIA